MFVKHPFRWLMPQIRLSLRSHLILLILISMVPLLIFATVMVVRLSQAERDTFRQGARERTLALITAVDTELKGSIDTLQGLAASDHLDTGDLFSFREDAERILKSQPDWRNIHLALPSGQQLMDLLHPPGSDQGMVEDRLKFEDVVRTTHPVIGDMRLARKDRIIDFVIQVPVMRDGVLKYVISASVAPEQINSLLLRQKIPENWTGSVIDGNGRFVARTAAMKESLGRLAPNRFRAALSRAPEGWIRGKSREGQDIYIPYSRSPLSGWTVGLAIPAASVDAILHRSLYFTILVGVAFLALGIALAWGLSVRTAKSIEGLSHLAQGLGLNKEAAESSGPMPITEVEGLREVLLNAARVIEDRSNQLREADRRKDEFLAMLGHELRNPLNVIGMTAQLLRSQSLSKKGFVELPERIMGQVSYMARLVDDLLDVSRITRGQIHLNMEPCDLTALASETLEEQQRLLAEAGLSLRSELPDEPLWVVGDRTRLKQVVGNGLQNAKKFTDSGGTVTVTLRKAQGENSAMLAIRDTGVGMDTAILKRAFEPFSQGERTIKRSRSGLGLGLTLVKGIIELHHGSVSLHSDGLGTGSELTFRLPLSESPSVKPVIPIAGPTFRPYRVLLIDDDLEGARAMGMVLAGMGHDVEVVHSGEEGIEAVRRFGPEVVVCDIGLPDMDGFAVARALRQKPKTARAYLIAVSGYGQAEYQRQASEAGFNTYLTKPIQLNDLEAVLDRVTALNGAVPV